MKSLLVSIDAHGAAAGVIMVSSGQRVMPYVLTITPWAYVTSGLWPAPTRTMFQVLVRSVPSKGALQEADRIRNWAQMKTPEILLWVVDCYPECTPMSPLLYPEFLPPCRRSRWSSGLWSDSSQAITWKWICRCNILLSLFPLSLVDFKKKWWGLTRNPFADTITRRWRMNEWMPCAMEICLPGSVKDLHTT